MSKRSSDDFDTEHTDELPVLLETVVLGEDHVPMFGPVRSEDTSEHTALYHAAEQPPAGLSAMHAEHAAEAAELQAELATLAHRARELEHRVAEQDRLIAELEGTVASLRESATDTDDAERRLAAQLAARDARIAEATATIEQHQRETAARSAELDALRTAAEAARSEADDAKAQLAARPAAGAPPQGVQQLLEDNATLRDYIAGRQTWWNELQVRNAELTAKVAALEQDLAESKKALAAADAFAARESRRAVTLRAELVEYSRRAAELERELRAVGTESGAAQLERKAAASETPSPPPAAAVVQLAPPPSRSDEASLSAGDAIGAAAPAVETIAQLEAEVGYKRQQVAAQLVELRERDQRLLAANADFERVRRELTAARNELDESRAAVARLERAVIDKDRALQARDARIATLHEELKQRLGAIEKLNSIEFAMPKAEPATPRSGASETGGGDMSAPVLQCLTGDAPKRFALTKKTIVVGRAPHCDLQILTHFVSREHARLTVTGSNVLIEDLGSRNGVYVNAIRVDRHTLQQGDLVTIGETQFRFMESMAH